MERPAENWLEKEGEGVPATRPGHPHPAQGAERGPVDERETWATSSAGRWDWSNADRSAVHTSHFPKLTDRSCDSAGTTGQNSHPRSSAQRPAQSTCVPSPACGPGAARTLTFLPARCGFLPQEGRAGLGVHVEPRGQRLTGEPLPHSHERHGVGLQNYLCMLFPLHFWAPFIKPKLKYT